MLRLALLLVLCTHAPAYVTDSPSFAERLDKLYEKLEKLTVAPPGRQLEPTPEDLLAKIDKLNALGPDLDRELSDEDEELLLKMQQWGLNSEQVEVVAKELLEIKEDRNDKLTDIEYSDGEWVDADIPEIEYPMDIPPEDGTGWDDLDIEGSTAKPVVTPSPYIRLDNIQQHSQQLLNDDYSREFVSAVDPVAATSERPRILDSAKLSLAERTAIQRAAITHMTSMVKNGQCLTPQPRWLSVRELAPAADTLYMPPCVQLHRCAHDSGCCNKEGEVCSPIEGKHVTLPFYLSKANGNLSEARMVFYNHTRCGCLPRLKIQNNDCNRVETVYTMPIRRETVVKEAREVTRKPREQNEGQIEWRSTEEPKLEKDEEPTAPTQLRRCTCPGLFIAKMTDSEVCDCVCEWPDLFKKRDCLSLARGHEHFGLRDRVCVVNGDCNPPKCEYGAYDRNTGRCPLRYRRIRFHKRRVDRVFN
ncbi:hypothetical protein O0L34_g11648 [Tuta absoluta]|nr:hypothetical protein O0L34_g11648 [Tuta absoluta]